MNDDIIADLKQFITTTVSQQLALQTDELRKDISDIRGDIKRLDRKIDDVDKKADAILEAVGEYSEETDKKLGNHEKRITRLEAKPA